MSRKMCDGGKPGKDNGRFECRKCGRMASSKKKLCKPEKA